MNSWQKIVVLVYGAISLFVFIKSFYEVKNKNNSFGLTPILSLLGIFVWGDGLILGIFWMLASVTTYIINSWYLFLLIISVFWVVRGLGETKYWLNQQYSKILRNPPEKLLGYSIFKNDSIWFIYQIIWQCLTVVAIIFSIYFAFKWLK